MNNNDEIIKYLDHKFYNMNKKIEELEKILIELKNKDYKKLQNKKQKKENVDISVIVFKDVNYII